jgi:hypothetical protein
MNRAQSKGELLGHYISEAGEMRDRKRMEVITYNIRENPE